MSRLRASALNGFRKRNDMDAYSNLFPVGKVFVVKEDLVYSAYFKSHTAMIMRPAPHSPVSREEAVTDFERRKSFGHVDSMAYRGCFADWTDIRQVMDFRPGQPLVLVDAGSVKFTSVSVIENYYIFLAFPSDEEGSRPVHVIVNQPWAVSNLRLLTDDTASP